MSHSQLPVLFLLTVWSLSIFGCKECNQYDFGVDHLVTETIITETSQSDHTRTTALSNSMKLDATQDRSAMVERSDRMWSTEKGIVNHFNILALRTP